MKKQLFLGACMLSFFATGCSNDELLENEGKHENTITINADIARNIDTRLTYTYSDGLKVSWSTNESFTLYKGTTATGQTFSKSGSGTGFTGTEPTGEGNYYAVYGNNFESAGNKVLTVDVTGQKGTLEENGLASFMVANAKTDLSQGLTFEHKLNVLQMNLTLPGATGKVDKVVVSGLHTKANYTWYNSEYTYNDETKADLEISNAGSGFTIADSKITAYLAVFPETVEAKGVTITAYVGTGKYTCTMGGKTLAMGKVTPITVTLKKVNFVSSYSYTQTDYYQWDAYLSFVDLTTGTWGEGNAYGNPTTTGQGSASCKDAPTLQQLVAYLKAGVYWDDNTTVTEGQMTYSAPIHIDGTRKENLHTGLWIKKSSKIATFNTETDTKYDTTQSDQGTFYKLSDQTAETVKEIRTGGDYFFLPAAGSYELYNNSDLTLTFRYASGSAGCYWLKTPNTKNTNAYRLFFNKEGAKAQLAKREFGMIPMVIE